MDPNNLLRKAASQTPLCEQTPHPQITPHVKLFSQQTQVNPSLDFADFVLSFVGIRKRQLKH